MHLAFKCIKAIVWVEAQHEAKKERRKREAQKDAARSNSWLNNLKPAL